MRWVRTRVLPLPGPARTRMGPSPALRACCCCGLGPSKYLMSTPAPLFWSTCILAGVRVCCQGGAARRKVRRIRHTPSPVTSTNAVPTRHHYRAAAAPLPPPVTDPRGATWAGPMMPSVHQVNPASRACNRCAAVAGQRIAFVEALRSSTASPYISSRHFGLFHLWSDYRPGCELCRA
jgi:hypothetical protein